MTKPGSRPGRGRFAGRTPSDAFRLALLVATIAGLIAVAFAAAKIGPLVGRERVDPTLPSFTLPTYSDSSSTPDTPDYPTGPAKSPTWLLILVVTVLVLALIIMSVAWWRQRGRTGSGRSTDSPADSVERSLPPTQQDLPFDVRAAADYVIAWWQHVESRAAAAGWPRRPHQTPTEFVSVLIDRCGVEPGAAGTLLRLYHHARFDFTALSPDSIGAAGAAGAQVAAALTPSRTPPPDGLAGTDVAPPGQRSGTA